MAQTEPINAYLGAHRSGLSIGAVLYQLDGTTVHAAFSTTGWYEAPASSGAWHHPGVSLPDAGGVVAVGVSGTEYMRVAVEAAKPLASDYTATRAAKLDNLDVTVSTAQAAIEAAIAALNDLSTADIDARLTAYDGATQTDLTATQTAITNAISALTNLSQAQAQTAATAALNAYDPPTKAELDTAQAAIIDAVPTTAEIDTQLSNTHGADSWEASGGLTAADIWNYSGTRSLTTATNNVTIVSAVNGGVVSLYAKDTWRFTINNTSLSLSGYEAIAFVIKSSESVADSASLLYVRSDSGLEYIDATDATAGDGTLTIDSATRITVNISIAVTDVDAGRYRWWIKGFDTTPTPDTGFTLAAGVCLVLPAGLRAIA